MTRTCSGVAAAALSLALLSSLPARAEDAFEFFREEAKTVTVASAKPESVFNSVSNVTVIDREMIERYNYESVGDALQTVAGVMVWRTFSLQHIPTFRGALQENYADKVLVMINNVPAWNAVTGEGDIDRVGIDSVERIEVLRGPASVIYGSNALNGAINIVLRQSPKNSHLTAASAGIASGHGGFSGAAEVSRAAGLYARDKDGSKLFVSADYSSRREPHFTFTDAANKTFEMREYFSAKNMNAAWSRGGHSLLANVSNSVQDFAGNNITLASGGQNPHEKEMELLSYAYSFGPEWRDLKYTAAFDRQRRQTSRDEGDTLRSDILGTRYVNTLSAALPVTDALNFELGGSHEYQAADHYNNFVSTSQSVVADNKMDNRVIWIGSLFAQLGYGAGPWKLALGTRFTHNSISGHDLSSRFSAVYSINDRSSLKFMAGQSFRAPTPFELYFQTTPVTVLGNPSLKPEKTSSAELSYLSSWEKLFAQLTAYYEDYKDTIHRDRGDFTRDGAAYVNANFYDNSARYHAAGAEAELRYTGPRLGLFSALSYIQGSQQDARTVAATGGLAAAETYKFKNVPRYTLAAGASLSAPNPLGRGDFFGSLVANHYSSMDTLRTRLPAQAWADLSAGYKTGAFKHTVTVQNVTGSTVVVPEYARQRVVESMPLVNGRRVSYTASCRF
ncbi:MAG: TonB-dependent receptor [Elusimicrobia bacterium]|nr:TonB-dependent receptor [Elusimicrobiota bacterium]